MDIMEMDHIRYYSFYLFYLYIVMSLMPFPAKLEACLIVVTNKQAATIA